MVSPIPWYPIAWYLKAQGFDVLCRAYLLTGRSIDAARTKLPGLHIFDVHLCAQNHGVSVTNIGMTGYTGKVSSPITTGPQNGPMCAKSVKESIVHVPREHAVTATFLAHQQVGRDAFGEELSAMLQAVLIKSVEDGMVGSTCGRAHPMHNCPFVFQGLATERAPADATFSVARERHAKMFQSSHCQHGR